jgi:hypothetical protein
LVAWERGGHANVGEGLRQFEQVHESCMDDDETFPTFGAC